MLVHMLNVFQYACFTHCGYELIIRQQLTSAVLPMPTRELDCRHRLASAASTAAFGAVDANEF
jgi:hypothetical protein